MTDRPTEDIVEIGARALHDQSAQFQFTGQPPSWDQQHPIIKDEWRECFRASLTALTAAGLVVVPVEPTPDMNSAGYMVLLSEGKRHVDQMYRAMIAAALPAPPATGGSE